MVDGNFERALMTICGWLLCSALGAQGVSVAPADKTDGPNTDISADVVAAKELPAGVNAKWVFPPKPTPLSWNVESEGGATWEYAWEVTHVRFNHSGGHVNDGMNLRWTFRKEFEHQVTSNSIGSGEYDVESKRNEAVLYKTSILPVVQVRMQVKDAQGNAPGQSSSALIRAEAGGGGSFMNLPETLVRFDAAGISVGPNGSQYVNFQLASPVPAMFGEYTVRYRFTLRNPKLDNGAGDMGPQDLLVTFDELSRIDVYSSFEMPAAPWNDSGYTGSEKTTPWVTALAFLAYPCGCADQSNLLVAADRTVKHLFWGHTGTSGHGMKYEHELGDGGFNAMSEGVGSFNLTQYMTKWKNGRTFNTVNCTDQACAVHTLLQLAWPGQTQAVYMKGYHNNQEKWFGYVNRAQFVGGVEANNPFYANDAYVSTPIVGDDDLMSQKDANGKMKRSAFQYHAAVRIGSSIMVDACMGAALPGAGLSLNEYLNQYRDTSTQAEQSIGGKPVFAEGEELACDYSIR